MLVTNVSKRRVSCAWSDDGTDDYGVGNHPDTAGDELHVDPMTLTLPTSSSRPIWEPFVVSNLSAFGSEMSVTSVTTVDDTVYGQSRDEGEFAGWPGAKPLLRTRHYRTCLRVMESP